MKDDKVPTFPPGICEGDAPKADCAGSFAKFQKAQNPENADKLGEYDGTCCDVVLNVGDQVDLAGKTRWYKKQGLCVAECDNLMQRRKENRKKSLFIQKCNSGLTCKFMDADCCKPKCEGLRQKLKKCKGDWAVVGHDRCCDGEEKKSGFLR